MTPEDLQNLEETVAGEQYGLHVGTLSYQSDTDTLTIHVRGLGPLIREARSTTLGPGPKIEVGTAANFGAEGQRPPLEDPPGTVLLDWSSAVLVAALVIAIAVNVAQALRWRRRHLPTTDRRPVAGRSVVPG